MDAVGGDFDFGNAAEGEQKLYEVLGRLFRSLFHNVGNGVGDRGLEHHTFGLQAGKVHTHELAGFEHDSNMLPPQVVKCKPSPMIPGGGSSQSILNDASGVARLFLRFVRTGLKTRHYRGKKHRTENAPQRAGWRLANHLGPGDVAGLIEQRIHALEESHGMRQIRVGLECGFVHP